MKERRFFMIPFLLVIKGIPSPTNQKFNSIGGAFIHIITVNDNINSAKDHALSFIRDQLWEPQEIEEAFEILPEQVPLLDKVEASLYSKALRDGISAMFVAYPKEGGSPNDPILIEHT
jgi:hypothetical protein